MEGRTGNAIFVVLFFGAIFLTDFLDGLFAEQTRNTPWLNVIVGAPMLLVGLITGLFVKNIKTLFSLAFFGSLCFMIFVGTNLYFSPIENHLNIPIDALWSFRLKELTTASAAMFIALFVLLGLGKSIVYIYRTLFLSFRSPKSEL